MDDIWKWMGFSTKQHATTVLEKHFVIDIDYKKSAYAIALAVLEEKKWWSKH